MPAPPSWLPWNRYPLFLPFSFLPLFPRRKRSIGHNRIRLVSPPHIESLFPKVCSSLYFYLLLFLWIFSHFRESPWDIPELEHFIARLFPSSQDMDASRPLIRAHPPPPREKWLLMETAKILEISDIRIGRPPIADAAPSQHLTLMPGPTYKQVIILLLTVSFGTGA